MQRTELLAVDPNVLKAYSHPIRQRILGVYHGYPGDPAFSPSKMSRELDVDVQVVSYHVRVLIDCGVLKLVETKPVRGAVEHLYKLS